MQHASQKLNPVSNTQKLNSNMYAQNVKKDSIYYKDNAFHLYGKTSKKKTVCIHSNWTNNLKLVKFPTAKLITNSVVPSAKTVSIWTKTDNASLEPFQAALTIRAKLNADCVKILFTCFSKVSAILLDAWKSIKIYNAPVATPSWDIYCNKVNVPFLTACMQANMGATFVNKAESGSETNVFWNLTLIPQFVQHAPWTTF